MEREEEVYTTQHCVKLTGGEDKTRFMKSYFDFFWEGMCNDLNKTSVGGFQCEYKSTIKKEEED